MKPYKEFTSGSEEFVGWQSVGSEMSTCSSMCERGSRCGAKIGEVSQRLASEEESVRIVYPTYTT